MSANLIILVAVIYFYVAIEQAMKGNLPMLITFGAYAISNIGLYLMASK
jgi:hypothetical protein